MSENFNLELLTSMNKYIQELKIVEINKEIYTYELTIDNVNLKNFGIVLPWDVLLRKVAYKLSDGTGPIIEKNSSTIVKDFTIKNILPTCVAVQPRLYNTHKYEINSVLSSAEQLSKTANVYITFSCKDH